MVSALTGRQYPNEPVKPILHISDSSPLNLVEYPSGTGKYYVWNLISGEVWRIHQPTQLSDILQSLKTEDWAGLEVESLRPDRGTQYVELDEPQHARPREAEKQMLNAPSHWSIKPEDLEDAGEEFLEVMSALTGQQYDPSIPVRPIVFLRDPRLLYLVEYPAGKGEYYGWNTISGEIWKILRPTSLDKILESLMADDGEGMDLQSLDPTRGVEYKKVDMPGGSK